MSNITSTGHTLTIDTDMMVIRIGGDLDTMDRIPESELDAACAAAGVRCTYVPTLSGAGYDVEALVTISDIAVRDDGDGCYTVTAQVQTVGFAGSTVWSAVDRHTAAGRDGLLPAGDSVDCWADGDVYQAIGHARTVALGEEILARARR